MLLKLCDDSYILVWIDVIVGIEVSIKGFIAVLPTILLLLYCQPFFIE